MWLWLHEHNLYEFIQKMKKMCSTKKGRGVSCLCLIGFGSKKAIDRELALSSPPLSESSFGYQANSSWYFSVGFQFSLSWLENHTLLTDLTLIHSLVGEQVYLDFFNLI